MYDTYVEIRLTGRKLWTDFITAFRPQTIKLRERGTVTKWYELLDSRKVYLNSSMNTARKTHKAQLIIDLLYRDRYYLQIKDEV